MSSRLSDRQREHFESIHAEYASHYYDDGSTAYRDRFIHADMFRDMDLDGRQVAEIMCGDGPVTGYLLSRYNDVVVEGFDISPTACEAYTRATGRPATAADITREALPASRYDVIAVSGGLHHVARFLEPTFDNIHAGLKPGGRLVAFEPNGHYALNFLRKIWYRADDLFDDKNEEALDARDLTRLMAGKFEAEGVTYGGGPAFFLVYNSLILRVPKPLKRLYTQPALGLEALWNRIPIPLLHGYFVARWRKA